MSCFTWAESWNQKIHDVHLEEDLLIWWTRTLHEGSGQDDMQWGCLFTVLAVWEVLQCLLKQVGFLSWVPFWIRLRAWLQFWQQWRWLLQQWPFVRCPFQNPDVSFLTSRWPYGHGYRHIPKWPYGHRYRHRYGWYTPAILFSRCPRHCDTGVWLCFATQ